MQKHKKKTLGAICLLAVAAMTAVAHAIPSPNASAVSSSMSATDTITVTVYDKYATVNVDVPQQNEIITDPEIDIHYDYSSARAIHFVLSFDGITIDEWTDEGLDYMVPGESTHHTDLPYFGDYVLEWQALGAAPGLSSEGSVEFKRYATKVVFVGFTKDNEPVFDIYYINEVESVGIQIYTNAGVPLFNPELKFPSSTDLRYRQIDPEGAF